MVLQDEHEKTDRSNDTGRYERRYVQLAPILGGLARYKVELCRLRRKGNMSYPQQTRGTGMCQTDEVKVEI